MMQDHHSRINQRAKHCVFDVLEATKLDGACSHCCSDAGVALDTDTTMQQLCLRPSPCAYNPSTLLPPHSKVIKHNAAEN
jgi:hypothetical protein